MSDEIIHAARLGLGLSAGLRCGQGGGRAGTVERGFTTPQWAMVWIASGSGVLRDPAGGSWNLGRGMAFQRLPGQVLDLEYRSPLRTCYLALPASCLEALRATGLPTADTQVLAVNAVHDWQVRFVRCARALRSAPAGRLAACLSELLALAVDLHLAAQDAEGGHAGAIDEACALLARDPLRAWTPAGLARAVGLGHHCFRKAFARRTGCGPAGYRLRLRLERAQELLHERTRPVAEVARLCGWDDPLQFSAVFRRRTGSAPRRWRDQHP